MTADALQFGQRNSDLRLILPLLVRIASRALIPLVGREEQHLRDAFVGVNAGGQGSRVRDLERDEAFPLGLERRHVGYDAAMPAFTPTKASRRCCSSRPTRGMSAREAMRTRRGSIRRKSELRCPNCKASAVIGKGNTDYR